MIGGYPIRRIKFESPDRTTHTLFVGHATSDLSPIQGVAVNLSQATVCLDSGPFGVWFIEVLVYRPSSMGIPKNRLTAVLWSLALQDYTMMARKDAFSSPLLNPRFSTALQSKETAFLSEPDTTLSLVETNRALGYDQVSMTTSPRKAFTYDLDAPVRRLQVPENRRFFWSMALQKGLKLS